MIFDEFSRRTPASSHISSVSLVVLFLAGVSLGLPNGTRLKALCPAGFYIGGTIYGGYYGNPTGQYDNAKVAEIVKTEYNILTCENELKMQSCHYGRTSYYWEYTDKFVNFCQANNIKARGHTLCYPDWGDADWFKNLPLNEVESEMNKHIDAVAGKYKGKIFVWDVVNEPTWQCGNCYGLNTNQNYYKAMGEGWIEKAFLRARAVDPNAILALNENFHEWQGEKQFQTIYDLVKQMKDKYGTNPIPVHAIGFECHYSSLSQTKNMDRLKTWINKFSSLGLKVYITEADIALCDTPGDEAALESQKVAFRELMDVALSSPACFGLITWGIWDGYSWLNNASWAGCGGKNAQCLLFDINYLAKPAYFGVQERLQSGKYTRALR
jgi:endo-1,4-beta-xylanase